MGFYYVKMIFFGCKGVVGYDRMWMGYMLVGVWKYRWVIGLLISCYGIFVYRYNNIMGEGLKIFWFFF